MKSITQEHAMGCGLACIAFVSKTTYESVIKKTDEKQAKTRGFYCRELVNILHEFGVEYEWKFVTNKIYGEDFTEGSIVYLKRSNLYPAGHYVAKAKNGWMNSWMNLSKDNNVQNAVSGIMPELPYRPSYVIRPMPSKDERNFLDILKV